MNSMKETHYTLTVDQKSDFYKKMITIAIPVIIQNIISIGLGMADTMMVGKLGEDQLAGVGAANQLMWLSWGVIFGYFSGAVAHASQYWGAGNVHRVRNVLGLDLAVGLTAGAFTIVCTYLFGPQLVWLFSRDPVVIGYGVDYMRIVCFGQMFSFLTFAFTFNCRVVQRLRVITSINCAVLFLNIFLNYCFIFGNFGFPRFEASGAAIATTICRALELMAVIIYMVASKKHPLHCSPREMFDFHKDFAREVTKTAFPVVITEVMFSVLGSATFAIYGILGSAELAVVQVAEVVANMAQVIFFGLGNAAAVTIGGALGQNDPDRAVEYGRISFKLSLILCAITCAVIFMIARPISGLYTDFEPSTIELLVKTLWVWSIITIPKMINYVIICGILRAGGDTIFSLKIDLVGNLGMQVPLALLAVLVFKWPLYFCILFVSINDVVKCFMSITRMLSKKWINIYRQDYM